MRYQVLLNVQFRDQYIHSTVTGRGSMGTSKKYLCPSASGHATWLERIKEFFYHLFLFNLLNSKNSSKNDAPPKCRLQYSTVPSPT
jgi:hypothetical protein